jgi:hypothetical protein
MNLQQFFEEIAPFLDGRRTAQAAAARLYGPEVPPRSPRDPERLAIYADSYRAVGLEMLSATFPVVRAWASGPGRPSWPELVRAYLRAHPPREVRYVQAGVHFPDFLDEVAAERSLPAWLPELADLELWHRLSMAALDPEASDPEAGPLRLTSTLEIRDYHHDLLEWLDADPRPDGPRPRRTLVMFWRTRRGAEARRATVGLIALAVIRMIRRGAPGPEAIAGRIPSPAEVDAACGELRRAGVIEGTERPTRGEEMP